MDGTDFVVPPVRQSYKQPIDLRVAPPRAPPAAEAREPAVSAEHVPVQPKTDDHAWQQPGATAYVRFGHLEGDDGWYECTLGEQEGGAWRVTWKNGDTEPDRLPAACLARAPPAEKPRDGALHRWVEVYWAGDAKWFLGRVVGEREGELKIAYTDGETHSHVMQDEPFAGAGAPPEIDDCAPEPWRFAEAPPRPKKRRKTARATKPCGPPEDQRLCKLVYQFLYHRATTRRLMYPSETVVSADGKALPAATLPEAGKGGFDHGPLIQSLGKMGNVGRGLDSGTVTMGDFVRAKLEHAGLQQGSDAWVGQAVLMCVHEMDNWLPDVNKAWTATTPEGGFRAPSTLGALGGANFPSSREEIWSFVAFAETLWDLEKPKFAGSFQNQGKRLLTYLPLRLYEIDDVVAALRAARTWADACDALLILSGVGDYVGGQALCTFFFGVCKGDVSRFAPNLDATTMKSFCLCGPGPEGVVQKMWGGVQLGKSEAVKRLAWLAENAEARFQALGLRFPFQRDADGARKRLTAVDLEHALCYFSRYLSAHDSLKAAGARIVHDKLAGPITRGECPRPSIKWFAKLKEKTAAKRCDKWLKGGVQEAFTS